MSEINTPERETTQAPDAKPDAKSTAAPAQAVKADEPNTRKRKLLEKQKEGKKKMKSIGRVEGPGDVFISALKLDD